MPDIKANRSSNEREVHREAERSHRQGVYHQLLDQVYQASRLESGPAMTLEDYERWRVDLMHLINGVRLFGAPSVTDAAENLVRVYARFDGLVEFAAHIPGQEFEARVYESWEAVATDWHEHALALRGAMREDVAPASLASMRS